MTCWASALGECSTKLSREHYVSAALFGDDSAITVQGFSWCKDEPKKIGLASATVKVLCTKHNSDLSPVDMAGLDAFKALAEFHRLHTVRAAIRPRQWKVQRRKVDGLGLERWFAKTAVNLATMHSTPLRWPSGAPVDTPPVEHLRAIFGMSPLEAPAGLYMLAAVGETIEAGRTVSFTPLLRHGMFCGGTFGFYGHRFVLSFLDDPLPADLATAVLSNLPHAQLARRLEVLRQEISGYKSHELVFDWRARA